MSLILIVTAMVLAAASGLPGLWLDRRRAFGQWVAMVMMVMAGALGLTGAIPVLTGVVREPMTLPNWLMSGPMTMEVDSLSAFFLAPIFLMAAFGPIYGLGYWRQAEHPSNARKLRLFWGWLVAGMALLVVARHGMLFLAGWEIMALSAFFLIGTEDHQLEVRRAGWLYLIATHAGTLCLFALFALLRHVTGSFDLRALGVHEAGLGTLSAIFVLALLGFGLKAGIMPLHFWLPSAHANAPSHVSAIMSGVLIKMGIYGLVRITQFLPQPPVAWGALLLILGAISGVLGVAFAIGQHDLKRLLAYHSVENIGIIVMGLGLAMVGRSLGRADWVVLGMAGCLLHVWNHALFKSLLFLGAGSVLHARGTREIDKLGGLAKTMPWTAGLFLIGALAICGLPPLNGFVSELFIYLGLFRTAGIGGGASWSGAALAIPILGIIGALALACFVKVYGAVFLGLDRSGNESAHVGCHWPDGQLGGRPTSAAHVVVTGTGRPVAAPPVRPVAPHGLRGRGHEAPVSMILPMVVLAGLCAAIGLAPLVLAPVLDRAIALWSGPQNVAIPDLVELAPLRWVGLMAGILLAATAFLSGLVLLLLRRRNVNQAAAGGIGTWDCGFAFPTARMQYTASSFAAMIVGLFRWVLRPHPRPRPRGDGPATQGVFAAPATFESHVDDFVLDRQIMPAARAAERWLSHFRMLQRGLTQHYVLYILITVVVMLLWAMPLREMLLRLLTR